MAVIVLGVLYVLLVCLGACWFAGWFCVPLRFSAGCACWFRVAASLVGAWGWWAGRAGLDLAGSRVKFSLLEASFHIGEDLKINT
jgi:hypothetical protein